MKQYLVGVVVVTYNRLELLKKNIEALANQTYKNCKIYIINNASTDGTTEFLANEKLDERFTVVNMPENSGGSGGFYQGVKVAYMDGCEFIWGMDDDAMPEPNALEALLSNVKNYEDKICYVSNVIYDDSSPTQSGLLKRESFLFLGFMIPRHLIDAVGLPRGDLFIYFDDLEYSNRATKGGYEIYVVLESVIRHPSMMLNSKRFSFLGKNFDVQSMPKWKWYYYMRNAVLAFPKKEYFLFRRSTKRLLLGVLLAYPENFGIALKGYMDGLANKSGKNEKLHR